MGSWIVPNVDSTKSPHNSDAAIWIGFDGDTTYTSGEIVQTGTDSSCESNGNTQYQSWYEFYFGTYSSPIFEFSVNPGDLIYGTITYLRNNQFSGSLYDSDSGLTFTFSGTSSGYHNAVEWILETGTGTLADFSFQYSPDFQGGFACMTGNCNYISALGSSSSSFTFVTLSIQASSKGPELAYPNNLDTTGDFNFVNNDYEYILYIILSF